MLPASSLKVTSASILLSGSSARSLPATSMLNVRFVTVPVYSLPFTVSVTTSPFFTSPETIPVIVTVSSASAAEIMSSDVTSDIDILP